MPAIPRVRTVAWIPVVMGDRRRPGSGVVRITLSSAERPGQKRIGGADPLRDAGVELCTAWAVSG